ncbi:hypothetical protein M0R45_009332 [Rubus argutus]|uniref:Uncharacterized protein n=1 Tax=Rubus argutus TaxID=59490 RepID=A0AAW1Y486_RUBAR
MRADLYNGSDMEEMSGLICELDSDWEQQLWRERCEQGGGDAVYGVDGWADCIVMSRCGDGRSLNSKRHDMGRLQCSR